MTPLEENAIKTGWLRDKPNSARDVLLALFALCDDLNPVNCGGAAEAADEVIRVLGAYGFVIVSNTPSLIPDLTRSAAMMPEEIMALVPCMEPRQWCGDMRHCTCRDRIERAIAQARAEALQEAIAAAESEPEPDDDVPDLTDYSKEELVRGTVRSTKKCIIERLRSLPGAQG